MPADPAKAEPLSEQCDALRQFFARYSEGGVILEAPTCRAFVLLFAAMRDEARRSETSAVARALRDEAEAIGGIAEGMARRAALLRAREEGLVIDLASRRPPGHGARAAAGDASTAQALAYLASEGGDWGDAP